MSNRWHRNLFLLFLVLWTIALLVPIPKESAKKVLGNEDTLFVFGKLVHVSVYTFLTVLGGSMQMSRSWRWGLLALFSIHAFGTEFFQQFVDRGSSLRDAILDHVGILAGVGLGWRWWRGLRASQPEWSSHETG